MMRFASRLISLVLIVAVLCGSGPAASTIAERAGVRQIVQRCTGLSGSTARILLDPCWGGIVFSETADLRQGAELISRIRYEFIEGEPHRTQITVEFDDQDARTFAVPTGLVKRAAIIALSQAEGHTASGIFTLTAGEGRTFERGGPPVRWHSALDDHVLLFRPAVVDGWGESRWDGPPLRAARALERRMMTLLANLRIDNDRGYGSAHPATVRALNDYAQQFQRLQRIASTRPGLLAAFVDAHDQSLLEFGGDDFVVLCRSARVRSEPAKQLLGGPINTTQRSTSQKGRLLYVYKNLPGVGFMEVLQQSARALPLGFLNRYVVDGNGFEEELALSPPTLQSSSLLANIDQTDKLNPAERQIFAELSDAYRVYALTLAATWSTRETVWDDVASLLKAAEVVEADRRAGRLRSDEIRDRAMISLLFRTSSVPDSMHFPSDLTQNSGSAPTNDH